MKAFEASFETVILRFSLMMAVVIISFIAGLPFLALIAVPIFLSALMGIKFEFRFQFNEENAKKNVEHRYRKIEGALS